MKKHEMNLISKTYFNKLVLSFLCLISCIISFCCNVSFIEADAAKKAVTANYKISYSLTGQGHVEWAYNNPNDKMTGSIKNLRTDATKTIHWAAADGWYVESVTIDDTALTADQIAATKYQFTDVREAHHVKVVTKPVDNTTFEITYSLTGQGHVEWNSNKTDDKMTDSIDSLTLDSTKTIHWEAADGWYVDSVTVDGTKLTADQIATNKYKFEHINANHNVDVVTKQVEHKIAFELTGKGEIEGKENTGTGTITGEMSVPQGWNKYIHWYPAADWYVDSVNIDGTALTADQIATNKYQFTDVREAHHVKVITKPIDNATFEIKYSLTGKGHVEWVYNKTNSTMTGSVNSLPLDSTKTIHWEAADGWYVDSVIIDGIPLTADQIILNKYKFTNINENHTVKVITESKDEIISRPRYSHSFTNVHAMLDCAETFFNYAYTADGKEGGILYETGNGLYSDSLGNNAANGQYGIVCSQFVGAVVNGITFNNSRYSIGSENTNIQTGYQFDNIVSFGRSINPTNVQIANKYLTSQALAKYAKEKGYLYTVKGNRNTIQAGDLLFSGSDPNHYLGINHVVMVINTDGTYCTVIESWASTKSDGNSVGLKIRYHELLSKFSYGAAFPIKYSGKNNSVELKTKMVDISSSNSKLSGVTAKGATVIHEFKKKVDQGFYTIVCTGTFDTAPYVSLRYDNSYYNVYQSSMHKVGNKYYLTVYAEKPAVVSLRMVAGNHYKNVQTTLYEGYAEI